MKLKKITDFRRAIKNYDTSRDISKEDWDEIVDFTNNSPTSMNWQTWRVVYMDRNSDFSKKISAKEVYFNIKKFREASIKVFFITPTDDHFKKGEIQNKRIRNNLHLRSIHKGERKEIHEFSQDEVDAIANNIDKSLKGKYESWAACQAYIGASFMTIGASIKEIDSIIVEGFSKGNLNNLLRDEGVIGSDETVTLISLLGYRCDNIKISPTNRDQNNIKFKKVK